MRCFIFKEDVTLERIQSDIIDILDKDESFTED